MMQIITIHNYTASQLLQLLLYQFLYVSVRVYNCLLVIRIKSLQKEEYDIVPKTWVLPSDYGALSSYVKEMKRRGRNRTYIVKPHNSSMGNGSAVYTIIAFSKTLYYCIYTHCVAFIFFIVI